MASINLASMQNPAWYLHGPKSAQIQDAPMPALQNDTDVIIKIEYVGVCGSDVHFWRHGGINAKVDPNKPLIVGHEAAGTISSIGSAVKSLSVGDRVAIEPGFPCRSCRSCKAGSYHFCPDMRFAAAPPDSHGCLAKYFRAPADFVYRVPEGLSLRDTVVVEPTAVAVHANKLAKTRPGQDVVIMGSGTVGLLCGAVAKAFGAARLVLVDVKEDKLAFAKEYLGCETYLTDLNASAAENAGELQKTLGLNGVDAVIEASGAESSVQMGIHILKMGGTYVQTGLGKPYVSVPLVEMSEKELRVRGCFRYGAGDWELALGLISRGQVKPAPLVSSVVPFDKAIDAWEKTGRGEGIKNIIQGVPE